MAKDMSKVYGDMLTKELVALRARHMDALDGAKQERNRMARKDVERLTDLIIQINSELASRVANFGLFV